MVNENYQGGEKNKNTNEDRQQQADSGEIDAAGLVVSWEEDTTINQNDHQVQ